MSGLSYKQSYEVKDEAKHHNLWGFQNRSNMHFTKFSRTLGKRWGKTQQRLCIYKYLRVLNGLCIYNVFLY